MTRRFLLSLLIFLPFAVLSQSVLRHTFTASDFAGLAGTIGAENTVGDVVLDGIDFSLTLNRTPSLSAEPFTVADIEQGCLVGEDNAGISELYIKSARLAKALVLGVSLEFGLRNATNYTKKSNLTVKITANGIENQAFKQILTTGQTYTATFAPGTAGASSASFDYATPLTVKITNASCDNLVLKSLEVSYYDLTADLPRRAVAYGTTLDIHNRYGDDDDCWYTLDGSLPTHENHLTGGQVTVTEALTIRTMTFPPASTKVSKQCADTVDIIPVNNATPLRRVAFDISGDEWPVGGEYPSTHTFAVAAVELSRADDDGDSDNSFTLTLSRERPNTSGTALGADGYQLLWNAGDTGVFATTNPDNTIEAVHLEFQKGTQQMANLGDAAVEGATLVNRDGSSVLTTAPRGGSSAITVTPAATADGDYARLTSASISYTRKSETTAITPAQHVVAPTGWYTLQGARLERRPARPGVYIEVRPGVGARKTLVR